jgi:hypothetical protein
VDILPADIDGLSDRLTGHAEARHDHRAGRDRRRHRRCDMGEDRACEESSERTVILAATTAIAARAGTARTSTTRTTRAHTTGSRATCGCTCTCACTAANTTRTCATGCCAATACTATARACATAARTRSACSAAGTTRTTTTAMATTAMATAATTATFTATPMATAVTAAAFSKGSIRSESRGCRQDKKSERDRRRQSCAFDGHRILPIWLLGHLNAAGGEQTATPKPPPLTTKQEDK